MKAAVADEKKHFYSTVFYLVGFKIIFDLEDHQTMLLG